MWWVGLVSALAQDAAIVSDCTALIDALEEGSSEIFVPGKVTCQDAVEVQAANTIIEGVHLQDGVEPEIELGSTPLSVRSEGVTLRGLLLTTSSVDAPVLEVSGSGVGEGLTLRGELENRQAAVPLMRLGGGSFDCTHCTFRDWAASSCPVVDVGGALTLTRSRFDGLHTTSANLVALSDGASLLLENTTLCENAASEPLIGGGGGNIDILNSVFVLDGQLAELGDGDRFVGNTVSTQLRNGVLIEAESLYELSDNVFLGPGNEDTRVLSSENRDFNQNFCAGLTCIDGDYRDINVETVTYRVAGCRFDASPADGTAIPDNMGAIPPNAKDGAGYGDGDGFVEGFDCNNNLETVHPGANEVCNGVDDDCDGLVDEGLLQLLYTDMDQDGHAGTEAIACYDETSAAWFERTSTSAERFEEMNSDCDDDVATTYPGAPELCDELDNDCDGAVDEGCTPHSGHTGDTGDTDTDTDTDTDGDAADTDTDEGIAAEEAGALGYRLCSCAQADAPAAWWSPLTRRR